MYLVFDLNAAILKQTAGAKGILMCGDKPLANTLVKLWDEDNGNERNICCKPSNTSNIARFVSSKQSA
jgi:hypothetical protein